MAYNEKHLVKLADLKALGTKQKEVADALAARVDTLENVGSQANVLEGVKVNGTALAIANKMVDILIATGSKNGSISVNGADVAIKGLAALAFKAKVSQSDLDDALAAVLEGKADKATTLDGYPMATKMGQPGRALGLSTLASTFGGIFSTVCLILLAPQLAKVALQFSKPEYFALAIFGLSIITSVSSGSVIKGIMGGLIGLFLATVGIDGMSGAIRFTLDTNYFMGGVSFIPVLIGVFAFALFNDWREQHQAFTFRLRQHVIHHLADGLRRQRYIVVRAARLTDAGEQQTQIVVDFGDCPHRRTRVMRRRFLLNRDGRRKPLNMIDVRLFHQ